MYKRGLELFLLNCGLILLLVGCVLSTTPQRPCPIAVRCSDIEQVVWSTDGQSCFVWRNACLLRNENCQRQNNYQPELREITKEECQKMCADVCPAIYSPVCAEYNGIRRTFSNSCTLGSFICRSGQTYSLISQGECVQNV